MGLSSRFMRLGLAVVVLGFTPSADAWWENGHEAMARGVLQNLQGAGDLQRFIAETNAQFVKMPWIEPAGLHYIDIDTSWTTTGNAGAVSYATDFANFRAGTFAFPTTTTDATARYGANYLSSYGAVPWLANDTLSALTAQMQAAQTYDDWYHLLPTIGALTHYLEDMHQPQHLTQWYNGNPSSGLHAKYEGGQFEDGSVWRYPELVASMTPVAPTYYGNGPGFINALFNRIPVDFDKNTVINNANVIANQAGTGAVYFDSLWQNTNAITRDSFQHGAGVVASALYTAYVNAGSPAIPKPTFLAAPAAENSTITTSGPITDYTNQDFFGVRGANSLGRYGVMRFDMADVKSQFDALYGPGEWTIDNVTLALETTGSSVGSLRIFLAPDDVTNIQTGSALRFLDYGAPLGADISADIPLLEFAVPLKPNFTITRFDSNTPEMFNWSLLQDDILNGGKITLIAAAATPGSRASYYGGPGLSLEVKAGPIPEPASIAGVLALGVTFLQRRRPLHVARAKGRSRISASMRL